LNDATDYVRKNQAIVSSSRIFPNMANVVFTVLGAGGAITASDSVVLGAFGWEEEFTPSMNALVNDPTLLQIFKEMMVGSKDGFVMGDGLGRRLEAIPFSFASADIPAHSNGVAQTVPFQRTYTTAPHVMVCGFGTGKNAGIIWVVRSVTTQDVEIGPLNADSVGTGAFTAGAVLFVFGS
jgi:hypothetical protein